MPSRLGRTGTVAALCVVLTTISTQVRCEILSPTRYWRNTFQGETVNYATEAEALAGGAAAYCAHPSNAILAGCTYAGGTVINVQMVANGPWIPVNLIAAHDYYACPAGFLLYPSYTENGVTLSPACQRDDPPPPPEPPEKKVVVIDPGHGLDCERGGLPPGAIGVTDFPSNDPPSGRMREDEMTMRIARAVQPMLEAMNYTVLLTKTSVVQCPPFEDRGAVAVRSKAKLLVSVHLDAPAVVPLLGTPVPWTHGTLTLYNIKKSASFSVAESMARSVSTALGVNNRGPRVNEDKAILKLSVSPTDAVLVEAGRLSGTDEIKLHAAGSVEKVASGIAQAVYEYLGK